MSVEVGQKAPDFTLPSDRGDITLSRYEGKTNVVLAFYPGDFSPLCTSEMQCFADDWTKFREAGAEILGISTDPIEKHIQFSKKLGLQFPLLSDRNQEVCKKYGVAGLFGERGCVVDKFLESGPDDVCCGGATAVCDPVVAHVCGVEVERPVVVVVLLNGKAQEICAVDLVDRVDRVLAVFV